MAGITQAVPCHLAHQVRKMQKIGSAYGHYAAYAGLLGGGVATEEIEMRKSRQGCRGAREGLCFFDVFNFVKEEIILSKFLYPIMCP